MAYQTVNPANNQLIKQYAAHSDADVEAALQQADTLYHSAWSKGISTGAYPFCTGWRILSTAGLTSWRKSPARRWGN